MTVAPSKSDGGKTLCLKCFYVKRGSFKAIKTPEFLKLKRKNPQLADKYFGSWTGLRFQCCFGQLLGQSLVHCWLIGKQKVATHFQKQCLAINVGLAVFHSSFKFIELFFVVMLVFGVFVLRLLRLKFQHVSKENVSNLGYFCVWGDRSGSSLSDANTSSSWQGTQNQRFVMKP